MRCIGYRNLEPVGGITGPFAAGECYGRLHVRIEPVLELEEATKIEPLV